MAIRLTADEAQVVADVAAETGLTWSDVMRQALRKAHAERFKSAKPKRKQR
ncbi:MAG: hypothetical protein KJ015_29755 [Myxococcales bacterium]|nr:hypothetical protein [Myxococcales bacterium]